MHDESRQALLTQHASETNFGTGGGAAVCKAEKLELKGKKKEAFSKMYI